MGSSFHPRLRHRSAHREGGYILITLMLMVALLAIGMMVATSKAAFQARRDREEELVHRGVQYARAVRLFFKKTGRYPTRVEELENTNNLRFLRKRYKDPITGDDFKILRMGDVKLTFGQGITGAMTPQAIAAAQNGQGAGIGNAISRGLGGMTGQPAGIATQTTVTATASDSSDDSSGKKSDSDSSDSKDDKKDKPSGSGLTFGGGPIVGVASTSKKESIRE
jgi:type II secretory pathway pseudopilin PulG